MKNRQTRRKNNRKLGGGKRSHSRRSIKSKMHKEVSDPMNKDAAIKNLRDIASGLERLTDKVVKKSTENADLINELKVKIDTLNAETTQFVKKEELTEILSKYTTITDLYNSQDKAIETIQAIVKTSMMSRKSKNPSQPNHI